MRIGVDLDDTICRTTEIVHDRIERYANMMNLNPLNIMNDEDLKYSFFSIYMEDIYTNVEVKRDVSDVLRRIRNRGNEIYVITSRNNNYVSTVKDVLGITKKWLASNNIEVDGIIISSYGDAKAKACKEYSIDLMIDDDPYNYKMITSRGINCLLFDDREKYDLKNNYVTSWKKIEEYIERNR